MDAHPDRMPQPKPSPPPEPEMPHGGYTALGMRTWEAIAPADPLSRLEPEELRLLWYNARADLLRTVNPATAALIRRGKCEQIVVAKMRSMVQETLRQL